MDYTTTTRTLSGVFPTRERINFDTSFTFEIPARTTISTLFFSEPTVTTIKNSNYEKLVEENSFLIQIILLLSGFILIVALSKMQIN